MSSLRTRAGAKPGRTVYAGRDPEGAGRAEAGPAGAASAGLQPGGLPAAVVLVTGAGRGLGRGIACRLARDGHSVAVGYARNAEAAAETLRLCEALRVQAGQRFAAVQGDLGEREQRRGLLAQTLDRLERIDALVNNAGMAPRVRSDILEATEESFEELLRVNLQGPYFLTQAVVRHWLEGSLEPRLPGGFKVLFVTSVSASIVSVNRGEYCVSKAGLSMAAQLWAARLAEAGIQVVELRPGIMKTDMTRGVTDKYERLIADGLVPERRWGTAEDVGAAAAAVIRGDLPFTTGSIIDVGGGLHLRRL